MKNQTNTKPKLSNTILFGNGFNLLSKENKSWNDLLKNLHDPTILTKGDLPNTMIYEGILFERHMKDSISTEAGSGILCEELKVKKEISEAYAKMQTHDIYKRLYALNADNYLTTNYDYAFSNSITEDSECRYINKSTEDIYSIRRKIEILDNNKRVVSIWHIHGEIKYPKTIMLGLDHYCGEVGKIDALIKGKYDFILDGNTKKLASMVDKLKLNETDGVSWVELFFTSNIYILGLSLDYSEIDLWWVLTKRARLLRDPEIKHYINNKICFYHAFNEEDTNGNISPEKRSLLESLAVEVIQIPMKKNEYEQNYIKMMENIENEIGQRAVK